MAWRHQARQGRLALPVEALSFVPVVAASDLQPARGSRDDAPAPPCAGPGQMIEVVLSGAVVRVPPEADGRLLAKVLRAAKAAG